MIVTNSQVASHKECPIHEACQKQKGENLLNLSPGCHSSSYRDRLTVILAVM